ncbi:MAG: winged helix-turn-helix domain-containing protein [Nitrososphaera sp.]
MINRQKDEMLRDILSCTNGGATISQIMFRAYTAHSQAKSYLALLMENGYVQYDSLDRKYKATAKGMEYLAAMQNLADIMKIETRRSAKIPSNRF